MVPTGVKATAVLLIAAHPMALNGVRQIGVQEKIAAARRVVEYSTTVACIPAEWRAIFPG